MTAETTGVRGLRVRVAGSALERGLVAPRRARARPWSARLAPWEAAGWEHALEPAPDSRAAECTLRAVRVLPGASASSTAPRRALACAVWVAIEIEALAPGDGALELSVSAEGESPASPVRMHVPLCVRAERSPEQLSLALAWDESSLWSRAPSLRAWLDAVARALLALPAAPRVLLARGIAPERLYLRPGCAVLAPGGLRGDARFRALWRRLSAAGGLESLSLDRVGGGRALDETLELKLAQPARYHTGALTAVLTLGRALVPAGAEPTLIADLASAARLASPDRALIAEHGWEPDGFAPRFALGAPGLRWSLGLSASELPPGNPPQND